MYLPRYNLNYGSRKRELKLYPSLTIVIES